MYKTILFTLFLLLKSNANVDPCDPNVISNCIKCIENIIQKEFTKSGLVIFAHTKNISTSVLKISSELLNGINNEIKFGVEVLSSYKETEVCNLDIDKLGVLHVDQYEALSLANYFVIIITNYQDFSYLASKLIRSRTWNPFAKFIILMYNLNIYNKVNITYIERILTCLFKYNAINILVVLPQANNYRIANIYRWKPYDPPNYCGYFNDSAENKLIEVNTCDNGILNHDNRMFDSRLPRDMGGCVLNILALQRQPYISDDKHDANIEKILLNRILKRFNMTGEYNVINGSRGERENVGQWNGGLQKLATKEGHILLGGIFPDFDVHEDFECSTTYLADAYAWVVPRASKLPPWMAFLIIFHKFVWYSAIAGFIICAISWSIIGHLCADSQYNKLFHHCLLNSWISIIGFVAYKRPVKESLRIFFVFLNLYSMLFLTAYQTKLFDTLTNPSYEYQIHTVQELVDSRLKFGGFEELHDLFINSSDPLDYYISTKWVDVHNITAAMIDVAVHRNFSFLCSRLQLDHISAVLPELSDEHGNYKYYVFPGNMFSVPIEIVALKGFPFIHEFSNTITLFKQSGLNEALRNQYAEFNKRRRARLMRSLLHKKYDVSPLSVKHLQGGFLALFFGYAGGSLIFILEIIIKTSFIQSKMIKIKKYLDI